MKETRKPATTLVSPPDLPVSQSHILLSTSVRYAMKRTFISSVLLFVPFTLLAQEWERQNPLPRHESLDDVRVFNEDSVIAGPQRYPHGRGSHSIPNNHLHYSGPVRLNPSSTYYSTEMHVHGSFSEGPASMESTTKEGRNVGLDVLWWSDHDHRITYYHHASTFSFENWLEPLSQGESWIPKTLSDLTKPKLMEINGSGGFDWYETVFTNESAFQGLNSMKVSGTSSTPEFSDLLYRFSATRLEKRALASDVTVSLGVLPAVISPDARPVVHVVLSRHEPLPPNVEWEQYSIHYFLTNDSLDLPYHDGTTYCVPVAFDSNAWNLIDFHLTQDAIAGFSYLIGIDNSMFEINLGIESRLSGMAVVYFDSLVISTSISGNDLFQVQGTMIDSFQNRIPEVTQLQGLEISQWKHLNEFGENVVLPDYDSIAQIGGYLDANGWITDEDGFREYSASYIVERAHERGSIVSYNHMYGASSDSIGGPDPQQTFEDLYAAGAYGVDLLEVGYTSRGGQDLSAHLWVWDELAKNGLCLGGTGVGDSHGLAPGVWNLRGNKMVSWIYAEGPSVSALLDGLARGRVFFGDLTLFEGSVDLLTTQGFLMGQVVLTDRSTAEVGINIHGLAMGDRIEVLWDGQVQSSYSASQDTISIVETHPIGSAGTFVRVAVESAGGEPKVFSNPIYFTRTPPAGGINPFKAGIDFGNLISTLIDGVTITNVALVVNGESSVMTIDGIAEAGTIVLRAADGVLPDSVRFNAMTGSWEVQDTLLVLFDLYGTGSIDVYRSDTTSSPDPLAQYGIRYGSTGNAEPNNPGALISIDPLTGVGTLIGPTGINGDNGPSVHSLAIKSTGEMYAMSHTTSSDIYSVDASTGTGTFVANTGLRSPGDICFDAEDLLYAVDDTNILYTIDETTGVKTVAGATGVALVGLAYDPSDGTMYGSGSVDDIYTIDLETGAATLVGPTGLGGSTPDIHFDQAGNLFGVKRGAGGVYDYIAIDKTTGAGTRIGSTGFFAVVGLATRLEPPPAIPCGDVANFQARCRAGGTIQARLTLANTNYTGELVEFSIDGSPYQVTVGSSGRANLSVGVFGLGLHTVEVTNPAGCVDPVTVSCRSGVAKEGDDLWNDEEAWEIPVTTTLLGNYPNPFNPSTTFRYALAEPGLVSLKIYNMLGQLVRTVVDAHQVEGYYEAIWDGRNETGAAVASGIYVYRMIAGSFVETKRMLLLR